MHSGEFMSCDECGDTFRRDALTEADDMYRCAECHDDFTNQHFECEACCELEVKMKNAQRRSRKIHAFHASRLTTSSVKYVVSGKINCEEYNKKNR